MEQELLRRSVALANERIDSLTSVRDSPRFMFKKYTLLVLIFITFGCHFAIVFFFRSWEKALPDPQPVFATLFRVSLLILALYYLVNVTVILREHLELSKLHAVCNIILAVVTFFVVVISSDYNLVARLLMLSWASGIAVFSMLFWLDIRRANNEPPPIALPQSTPLSPVASQAPPSTPPPTTTTIDGPDRPEDDTQTEVSLSLKENKKRRKKHRRRAKKHCQKFTQSKSV